jgi:crotonobetainyl-CoA:carnitine CoA-transferase CaiB-like acyl-CoA transferase
MVLDVEHPVHGKVREFGVAIKLSDTPGHVRTAAPLPGEHTDQVLQGLGLAAGDIAALRAKGVVE